MCVKLEQNRLNSNSNHVLNIPLRVGATNGQCQSQQLNSRSFFVDATPRGSSIRWSKLTSISAKFLVDSLSQSAPISFMQKQSKNLTYLPQVLLKGLCVCVCQCYCVIMMHACMCKNGDTGVTSCKHHTIPTCSYDGRKHSYHGYDQRYPITQFCSAFLCRST